MTSKQVDSYLKKNESHSVFFLLLSFFFLSLSIAAEWLSTKADLVIIFYVDIISFEIFEPTFTILKYNLLKAMIPLLSHFLTSQQNVVMNSLAFSCSYLSQGCVFLYHFLVLQGNT